MRETNDIWFMVFLIQKGFDIKSYENQHRTKIRCFFDIELEQWKQFKLEYSKSDIFKIKETVIRIKELGKA